MRKVLLAALALSLVACAHKKTAPAPTEVSALPSDTGTGTTASGDELPPPAGLSTPSASDSATATATEPETPLATDVVAPPESISSATATSTAASDQKNDSLLAEPTAPTPPPPPPVDTLESSADDTSTDTASSTQTEPEAPVAPSASAAVTPPPPVVAAPPGTSEKRNIYQDYKEYKDRAKVREEAENSYESRALFPHEDGAYQFGIDFVYQPFHKFDFDPSATGQKFADSLGGQLSFGYFPLRSLSYGRLGVSVDVAAYWTKYTYTTGDVVDSSRKHSIDTYGARLVYEFDYWIGQTVVPFAFYGVNQAKVHAFSLSTAGVAYPSRTLSFQDYGGGLNLNLNRLEPSDSSTALADDGIRKFYLTYTLTQNSLDTGLTNYLGLRFEY
jgi:hypothetical protein